MGVINGDGRTQFGLLRSIPGERRACYSERRSSPVQVMGRFLTLACFVLCVHARMKAVDEKQAAAVLHGSAPTPP